MKIENLFSDRPFYTAMPTPSCCGEMYDTPSNAGLLSIAFEHRLELIVNGKHMHTFTCSPSMVVELCIGWLIGEGLLADLDAIEELLVSENGSYAYVRISDHTIEPPSFAHAAEPDTSRFDKAIQLLYQSNTVHAHTHSTHGCVLLSGDRMKLFEDIGRYNAIDKAVGYGAIHALRAEDILLCTTGRVSEKAVEKMFHAGIPRLFSKSTATQEAIKAAIRRNISLYFTLNQTVFSSWDFCDTFPV